MSDKVSEPGLLATIVEAGIPVQKNRTGSWTWKIQEVYLTKERTESRVSNHIIGKANAHLKPNVSKPELLIFLKSPLLLYLLHLGEWQLHPSVTQAITVVILDPSFSDLLHLTLHHTVAPP